MNFEPTEEHREFLGALEKILAHAKGEAVDGRRSFFSAGLDTALEASGLLDAAAIPEFGLVAAAARRCCTAWNDPSGRPNCRRFLTCSATASSAPCRAPVISHVVAIASSRLASAASPQRSARARLADGSTRRPIG